MEKEYRYLHMKRWQDLSLGYDPWDLGLQMHQTDCEPVLDKMGIEYDPDEKYNTSMPDKKVKITGLVNV